MSATDAGATTESATKVGIEGPCDTLGLQVSTLTKSRAADGQPRFLASRFPDPGTSGDQILGAPDGLMGILGATARAKNFRGVCGRTANFMRSRTSCPEVARPHHALIIAVDCLAPSHGIAHGWVRSHRVCNQESAKRKFWCPGVGARARAPAKIFSADSGFLDSWTPGQRIFRFSDLRTDPDFQILGGADADSEI